VRLGEPCFDAVRASVLEGRTPVRSVAIELEARMGNSNQANGSRCFDSDPFVPGSHSLLILHGIAETFGLDAELA
jgi:hypothetical protein